MRKNIIRVTLGRTSRVFFSPEQTGAVLFFTQGEKGVYVGTFADPFPFSWGRKEGKDKHVLFSAPTPFWPAMDGLVAQQQPAPNLNQQSPHTLSTPPSNQERVAGGMSGEGDVEKEPP